MEALVRYQRAAFFDDELTIRTKLAQLTRAALRFEYTARRGEELLATGYTLHACVRLPGGRPTRVPAEILALAP